jgi:phenol/toluene 2-monooxygenase (NADH) P1/A1
VSIEIKTTSVEPLRRTFDHIAEKLGGDKPASRYQEAVWGLQPALNFHYRPTWDQNHALYDPRRTAIVMRDFDDLIDPRQYYYGTWTMQRGRQQDSQEKNFDFVEKRDLLATLGATWRDKITRFVLPMRHVAWAANANNAYICAYGYGAPVTSAAGMHMMDELGVAQYLSRAGLMLGDNDTLLLDSAKAAWMQADMWQPMRALIETSMVTKDWFELFVLQNLLIDGMVHPLVFERFDARVIANGGAVFSMLSEFMVDWYAESSRWVDAVLKIAAAESSANRAHLEGWISHWLPQVSAALTPLAEFAMDGEGASIVAELVGELRARVGRLTLQV